MVDAVRSDDILVFTNEREAKRVQRLVAEIRGFPVKCIVSDVDIHHLRSKLCGYNQRIVLDHSWVEAFYERAIDIASREIDGVQDYLD